MKIKLFKSIKNQKKGQKGEDNLFKVVSRMSKLCQGKIVRNLYLEYKEGKTVEIDMVMICNKGVYVFENKNYKGRILGTFEEIYWTQKFTDQINKFYNPFKQNDSHIRVLKKHLGTTLPYFSYITFSNEAKIENINLKLHNQCNSEKICQMYNLKSYLQKDILEKENVLSLEQIEKLYLFLEGHSNVDKSVKKQHIYNIRHT